MKTTRMHLSVGVGLLLGPAVVAAQDHGRPAPPRPTTVAAILDESDRALVARLDDYARRDPTAGDVDQAYLTLFDKVLDHEWYTEAEAVARRYLAERADGPARPIAQVVALMGRARAGKYAEGLAGFKELLAGLDRADQDEFAVQVGDNLARDAVAAGEYAAARQALEALAARFRESVAVRQKVADVTNRLDKVGKPAPALAALDDIRGKPVKLADYRGKYVLIDFWATFCAPCVADLPRLQSSYAKYRDRGFEVVGVSLDETREAVVDFAKARRVPWRQVHNATGGDDAVAAFGVTALPATFLIDPKGTVVRLDLRGDALDAALASYLDGPRR